MSSFSILAISVLMLCAEKVKSQSHGDLRLVQQDSKNASFTAGRLEIFMNSAWGSICADNFDMIAADVACRQLCYFAAQEVETSFHTPYGRRVDGPIWLDEVSCNDADLLHILSCSHIGLQETDCDHFSDVAVKCTEQARLTHPNDMDVRVVGGDFKSQGMLEVHCNGTWAPVCPLHGIQFGKAEGDAVCRQLGYTESIRLWTSSLELVENTPVYTQQLECPEGAKNIESCGGTCGVSEGVSEDSLAVSQPSCVFINCTHSVPYGSLRLSQGSHITPGALEGRLEIFYDGKWNTVCSYDFDLIAANVSCKQLGFVKALNYTRSVESGFGEGATGSASLGGIHCTSEDSTLIQCTNNREQKNCTNLEDVAVFCTNFSFEPPTLGVKDKYVFSLKIFIAAVIGFLLFFIMFSVCLAVYKLHFTLIPYDTMKEQSTHGLYFTEYEGSSFSLDQKLPEFTEFSTSIDFEKYDKDSSEQQPWHKKRNTKMKNKSSSTLPSSVPPKSSLPTHPQNSFLPSPNSSTSTNPTATPIPLAPMTKKIKQERTYSMKDPVSKSLTTTTSPCLTPDKSTHVQPDVGNRTRQGSRSISKSSGSDQSLPLSKAELYKNIRKHLNQPKVQDPESGDRDPESGDRDPESGDSDKKLLPMKLESFQGIKRQSHPDMQAPESSNRDKRSPPVKPEPYEGIKRQMSHEIQAPVSSGSDQKFSLVMPEPYKGIRKVMSNHDETQASEGASDIDHSFSRVIMRHRQDQSQILDATAAPNSSAGSPATHTRHDQAHRVSFKLE